MKLEDLTPEQQEKARACKTREDIVAFAKEIGYELSEDELTAVSGGAERGQGIEACGFNCPTFLEDLCQGRMW